MFESSLVRPYSFDAPAYITPFIIASIRLHSLLYILPSLFYPDNSVLLKPKALVSLLRPPSNKN